MLQYPVKSPSLIVTMLICGLAILLQGCSEKPQFQGTSLDPARDTLNFTLHDQFAKRISLADFRGKVVVITFLYTSCPDLCPLVTDKLHQTYALLGDTVSHVAFLAVTVDPERDTVARVHEYSQQKDMLHKWHFLVGSTEELQPLWDYYWVGAVGEEKLSLSRVAEAAPTLAHTVQHQSPVHLIDQKGKVRVAYGHSFRPAELAHDIEALLP